MDYELFGPETWVVEVQHSSDHNLDGVWHELDRFSSEAPAITSVDYFGVERKGSRYITGAYAGRPLRHRCVDGPPGVLPFMGFPAICVAL